MKSRMFRRGDSSWLTHFLLNCLVLTVGCTYSVLLAGALGRRTGVVIGSVAVFMIITFTARMRDRRLWRMAVSVAIISANGTLVSLGIHPAMIETLLLWLMLWLTLSIFVSFRSLLSLSLVVGAIMAACILRDDLMADRVAEYVSATLLSGCAMFVLVFAALSSSFKRLPPK